MSQNKNRAESIRRANERAAKYARAFDHDEMSIDYDCDATRDYDATIAAIETRESITRYVIAH